MKPRLYALVLSCLAPVCVYAQSICESIADDPSRAAGDLHVYEVFDSRSTPAPDGYTPFYVSHYGRHGSRYHSTDSFFTSTVSRLEKCRESGLLTKKGFELLATLKTLQQEHEEMTGVLTQVGAKQHQGIAERLYEGFHEVFEQEDRKEILAVSSTSGRCIQSMANFCTAIKGHAPQLDIEYITGKRYMGYICHPFDITYMHERKHEICNAILNEGFDTERLMMVLFTDPAKAKKHIGGDKFFKTVFDALCIAQNLDIEMQDPLTQFFTLDELTACNRSDNARYFATWCISNEFGNKYVKGVGGPLLNDIVVKANEAVKGNGRAADLRFGHDSGITPLLALIGAEGFEVRSEAEAADSWPTWKYTCMASNIQLIFFRNEAGDVLVKLRRNESEFIIPGLKSVTSPYYSWPVLREYFISLCR